MKTNVPGYVAKIYHQPSYKKIKKLQIMVKYPPKDPTATQNHVSIAWPIDLLSDSNGDTLGYLMPEIHMGTVLNNVYTPKLRKKKAPGFDWKYLHTAAKNIASAVSAIHNNGYVIGDVNPQNILVNNQAAVSIIDTDSFQVREPDTNKLYRCPVGSPGFTPVELLKQNADFTQIDRTEIHDRFGLATIIYLLLFCGTHPYSGKWKGKTDPPQDQNSWVEAGAWPYSKNSPVEPVPNSIPLGIVHPALMHCFIRAFGPGHIKTTYRPTAAEWYNALNKANAALKKCSNETSHWFDSTNGICYWCHRKSSSGYDYFPPDHLNSKKPVKNLSLNSPNKQKSVSVKYSPTIYHNKKNMKITVGTITGQKLIPPHVPIRPHFSKARKGYFNIFGGVARSDLGRLTITVIIGYLWGVHTLRWSGDEFVNIKQILIHSTYLIFISLLVLVERRITYRLSVPKWLSTNQKWIQLVLFITTAALYAAISRFYHLKPTYLYDVFSLLIFILFFGLYYQYRAGFFILSLLFFCSFSHFLVLIPILVPSNANDIGIKIASCLFGFILLSAIVSFSNPNSNMTYIHSKKIKSTGLVFKNGVYGAFILNAIGPSLIISVIIWYLVTANIIPPVPIHIRYSGIFYNVHKESSSDGNYSYSLEKLSPPLYKFWQDDIFYLNRAFDRDNKIYAFVAVFAPFCLPIRNNNQYLHLTDNWDFYNPGTKLWETKRRFSWKMKGGRWGGWRTYESIDATNIEPGRWRVRTFSVKGHLVGEINFRIALGYGNNWNINNFNY